MNDLTHLAFVLFTVIAPLDRVGERYRTPEPVECAAYIDNAVPMFEYEGLTVIAQCEYTFAPMISLHPPLRPDLRIS